MASVWTKLRRAAPSTGLTSWRPAEVTNARVTRVAKEAFWVAAGQGLAVGGALVGVRLLTELMPPAAYGELALGLTAATLLNQIVFGPVSNGAGRFYAVAQEAADIRAYLAALKGLALTATRWILAASVSVAGLLLLTGYGQWLRLLLGALMFGLLSGYNGILDAIQNGARQRVVVAWHQSLASWGRFLAAAGLVFLFGASSTKALADIVPAVGGASTAAMLGFTLASLVVLGSQLWVLRRTTTFWKRSKPVPSADTGRWREQLWRYSWPFATWGIFSWVQQASDRWALQAFASTRDVGYYAVLFQIGCYPIMLLSGVLVQWMGPILFKHAGDGSDVGRLAQARSMNRVLLFLTAGISLVAVLIAWGFNQQILYVVAAAEYGVMSPYLPWMVLSGGVFAVGQTMSLQLMAEADSRLLIVPKVVTAVFGIGANVIGAAVYGIVGVVAANVMSVLLYCLLMFVLVKSSAGKR